MDLSQRLDEMELAIHKPSFRKGTGRANEVNYCLGKVLRYIAD